jgi:hypothetical protein
MSCVEPQVKDGYIWVVPAYLGDKIQKYFYSNYKMKCVKKDSLNPVPIKMEQPAEPFNPTTMDARQYYMVKSVWWLKRKTKSFRKGQRILICTTEIKNNKTTMATIDLDPTNVFCKQARVYLSNLSPTPV